MICSSLAFEASHAVYKKFQQYSTREILDKKALQYYPCQQQQELAGVNVQNNG
jgi:hypothetical protein